MDMNENFFYSAMYSAWCVGLLIGTLVASLVSRQDYMQAEKRSARKAFIREQGKTLESAVKRARLGGLRDARAVLRQSVNLNDADRKLGEVERRAEAG